MKSLNKIAISMMVLAAASAFPRVAQAMSVRDVKYEITDTAIVFPESVQADVHKMQQNWYLQTYVALDSVAGSPVAFTDEELIKRLQAMPTTIEMPFNQVVRSHVDLYVNRRRSLVETMLGLSLYYMPIFEEALERHGLPLELRNLPIIESAMNPDAVSRAGATGLWQLMLPTARGLGLEINTLVDERRDPVVSTDAAVRYLKQLYGIYNNWSLAIAAYNCGPGNVNKALTRAGASAENPKDYWDIYYYLPAETRGYVPAFIGASYAMQHYADHGISPALAKRPILTDTVHVNDRLHFSAIASVLDIPTAELRTLNPQYRQDIVPGDLKPYALRLPAQMVYNFLMFEDSIKSASAALAPRAVVEIGSTDTDSEGYTWRETVKWHKVRRGETLSQVARKYGVTARQIKKWNGLRSNKLTRGRKLKIVGRERVAAPKPKQAEQPSNAIEIVIDTVAATPVDTIAAQGIDEAIETVLENSEAAEETSPAVVEEEVQPEPEPEPAPKPKAKPAPKTKTHKVVKGETLYSIAKRYGVTVKQIQQANNLSGSALSIGKRLKIPVK